MAGNLELRARAVVEQLIIPVPFSVTTLTAAVEDRVGWPITLNDRAARTDLDPSVSGMTYPGPDAYQVFYPMGAETWWALLCLCHELAHILCGHVPNRGAAESSVISAVAADVDVDVATARELTRTVDAILPDMQEAQRVWGIYRCTLDEDVEQEAEMVASLLVGRVEAVIDAPPTPDPTAGSPVLGRFARVLGSSSDHSH